MSQRETDKTEQQQKNISPTSDVLKTSASKNKLVELDDVFDKFCKDGAKQATEISCQNIEKWFEQAKVFTKDLTKSDTNKAFARVARGQKGLPKDKFKQFLNELAEEKKIQCSQLERQLKTAGGPNSPRKRSSSPGSPKKGFWEGLTKGILGKSEEDKGSKNNENQRGKN